MKLHNLLAAFAAVIASTAALYGAGEVWVGGQSALRPPDRRHFLCCKIVPP